MTRLIFLFSVVVVVVLQVRKSFIYRYRCKAVHRVVSAYPAVDLLFVVVVRHVVLHIHCCCCTSAAIRELFLRSLFGSGVLFGAPHILFYSYHIIA